MQVRRKGRHANTGKDLLSEGPSKWNVLLTGGGGNRSSVGVEKGVKTMIVLTGPIGKGNMSHFKEGSEVMIQITMQAGHSNGGINSGDWRETKTPQM
jgi:hypothetical protein